MINSETLQAEYDDWFQRLQALTDVVLNPKEWTERWFDGYSPAEALEDGPEDCDWSEAAT